MWPPADYEVDPEMPIARFWALMEEEYQRGIEEEAFLEQEWQFLLEEWERFRKEDNMTVCRWCGQPLSWQKGRGWVHPEGGIYVQRCPRCGWIGAPSPSLVQCPACGSNKLRDDHAAMPVQKGDR